MPAAAANWNGTPAPNAMVGSWKYIGCQSEVQGRLLRGVSTSYPAMTIESCMKFCSDSNYGLAGLEYGQECYCGNALATGAAFLAPPTCTMPCNGGKKDDKNPQRCGGANSVSVFNNTAYVATQTAAKPAGWTYVSCFMEPQVGRALPEKLWADPGMTVEKCTKFCDDGKYGYAGLEYGDECWCAGKLTAGLQDASDPSCAMQCNMACQGNNKQMCGGAGTVNVYKKGNSKRDEEGVYARNGRFVKVTKPAT